MIEQENAAYMQGRVYIHTIPDNGGDGRCQKTSNTKEIAHSSPPLKIPPPQPKPAIPTKKD